MGQAGFLEGYFEDDYPRQLQADYEALRTGASLSPIGNYLWRFFRIRPSAFPTIRISQFANLLSTTTSLFPTLLEMTDVKAMERFFNCQATNYWDTHYHFDQVTERKSVKRVGRMQADTLIIGLIPENAAQSQALIQLYNNYCSCRRCLDCHIGHNIIKQKSS